MSHQETIETHKLLFQKPEGSFYIAWIILSILCVPVAFIITLLLLGVVSRIVGDFIYVNGVQHITEDYLSLYLFFPLVGLLTGLAQYGLLRSLFPHMGGWVLATAVGWILGFLLFAAPNWLDVKAPNNVDLLFLLLGLSLGLGQWLVLRQRLPHSIWWVPASLLGWGLLALFTSGNAMDQFGLLSMSLLPACTTAAALRWLVGRSNSP